MTLLTDTRASEPHAVIGDRKLCPSCGNTLVNDEVWGWLHTYDNATSTPSECTHP